MNDSGIIGGSPVWNRFDTTPVEDGITRQGIGEAFFTGRGCSASYWLCPMALAVPFPF